ncbi:uncharacterized protein [Paramisgurnus dabryanus]|uniref:uncharacterized protein n=1 Tax=Paramisgurnus dabryanus TaxID=90735 RepID=UPI003CCF12A5
MNQKLGGSPTLEPWLLLAALLLVGSKGKLAFVEVRDSQTGLSGFSTGSLRTEVSGHLITHVTHNLGLWIVLHRISRSRGQLAFIEVCDSQTGLSGFSTGSLRTEVDDHHIAYSTHNLGFRTTLHRVAKSRGKVAFIEVRNSQTGLSGFSTGSQRTKVDDHHITYSTHNLGFRTVLHRVAKSRGKFASIEVRNSQTGLSGFSTDSLRTEVNDHHIAYSTHNLGFRTVLHRVAKSRGKFAFIEVRDSQTGLSGFSTDLLRTEVNDHHIAYSTHNLGFRTVLHRVAKSRGKFAFIEVRNSQTGLSGFSTDSLRTEVNDHHIAYSTHNLGFRTVLHRVAKSRGKFAFIEVRDSQTGLSGFSTDLLRTEVNDHHIAYSTHNLGFRTVLHRVAKSRGKFAFIEVRNSQTGLSGFYTGSRLGFLVSPQITLVL